MSDPTGDALAANSKQFSRETVERVARAISPEPFIEYERLLEYMLKRGENADSAHRFAAWCEDGQPLHRHRSWALEAAERVMAAIGTTASPPAVERYVDTCPECLGKGSRAYFSGAVPCGYCDGGKIVRERFVPRILSE